MSTPTNWFDQGGQAYAQFRPEYPAELAMYLASISPTDKLAVDVGCGSGQLTTQLGDHFKRVIGLDPSADQLMHATEHPKVEYRCSTAEELAVESGSASLITAAQAAHWFNLTSFYAEVRRIAAPGAIVSLLSYGVLTLDRDVNERLQQFYWEEIGPFWPAERKLVDSGYASIEFPFDEQAGPTLQIRKEWTLDDLLGYISTWSSVRRARDAGMHEMLQHFADEIAALWGPPKRRRLISWPINMRLGSV